MSDANPYKSPLTRPESEPGDRRSLSSFIVFLMATIGSILIAVAGVGTVVIAAGAAWRVGPTGVAIGELVACIWCGRLAVRIYRRELWR